MLKAENWILQETVKDLTERKSFSFLAENKIIKDLIIKLQLWSMRDIIIISGIPEQAGEDPDQTYTYFQCSPAGRKEMEQSRSEANSNNWSKTNTLKAVAGYWRDPDSPWTIRSPKKPFNLTGSRYRSQWNSSKKDPGQSSRWINFTLMVCRSTLGSQPPIPENRCMIKQVLGRNVSLYR